MDKLIFSTYNKETDYRTRFSIQTEDYHKIFTNQDFPVELEISKGNDDSRDHYFNSSATADVTFWLNLKDEDRVSVREVNISDDKSSVAIKSDYDLSQELIRAVMENFFVSGLKSIKRIAKLARTNHQRIIDIKDISLAFKRYVFSDIEAFLKDENLVLVVTKTATGQITDISESFDNVGKKTVIFKHVEENGKKLITVQEGLKGHWHKITANKVIHHAPVFEDWMMLTNEEKTGKEESKKKPAMLGIRVESSCQAYLLNTLNKEIDAVVKSDLVQYDSNANKLHYLKPEVAEALKLINEELGGN